MFGKKLIWGAVIAAAITGYVIFSVFGFFVEYLWFDSQNFIQVFRTIFFTELIFGLIAGVISFLCISVNLLAALKVIGEPGQYISQELMISPLGQFLTPKMVQRVALLAALAISVVVGFSTAGMWDSVLLYFNGGDFGEVDPIFFQDVGFFIFSLPFFNKLETLIWSVGVLTGICVGIIYFIKLQSERKPTAKFVSLVGFPLGGRLHMAIMGSILLLIAAWGFYLKRYSMLYQPGGLFTGPGYADIYGTLPIIYLKIAASFLGIGILFYTLLQQRFKILIGAAIVFGVLIVGGNGYVSVIQRFVVSPNELEKERVYLKYHIAGTNRAYALDKVVERSLNEDTDLTMIDIQNNRATINNIRLWDHEPLLDTFSQIQEIRTYYEFGAVDNDRYLINGELRQTMLSPRELNPASLPSRTWVNERLTFTHGYGLTLGPVNRVNEQGLPVLFVKDLPPVSDAPELQITRPEIYYGELPDNYVFVNTNQKEFNYPQGDTNVFSTYDGKGGVLIGGFFKRLVMATHLRDVKILLADDFTENTKVLLFRNINQRVKMVTPFLLLDRDPYLVIHEGRLVWILDAYTKSKSYPYSQVIKGLGNYIRNPIKVVVDAYNGDMIFYLIDKSDPIALAYSKIFPDLFTPIEDMPQDLRNHLRHPFDYFSIQTSMYATYHMLDENTFYNKEDQWEVPVVGQKRMEPYFTVMKLPGEKSEEFILMLPFTPRLKDNLAAWMVARSDGEHYGKLVVYTFPKQKLIFGPKQMVARMNQDPNVSQQITLWDQSGSNVIRGTLLVIPIESSLIYIQPLYLRAEEGRIPELKRVVVGYQNTIAMGVDLENALEKIFGSSDSTTGRDKRIAEPVSPLIPFAESPSSKAMQHYLEMRRSSKRGDWARFGKELNALGKALRELEKQSP